MFGISGEKLIILGIIAMFVIGPQRLPVYAKQFANLIKSIRRMADGAKSQLQDELGEELDWKKLDPRQYDPRRIIREALTETDDGSSRVGVATSAAVLANSATTANSTPTAKARLADGEVAPFDSEAT